MNINEDFYPVFAEDHVHALRMNAKKKLLCGMSLDGQAIPVGGIIPTPIGVGTIKVPRAPSAGSGWFAEGW